MTKAEKALAERMAQRWAAFAKTGVPSPSATNDTTSGPSDWPSVNQKGTMRFLNFSASLDGMDSLGDGLRLRQCELVDRFEFSWNPPTVGGGPF